jgi:hypothetical protein
VVVLQDFADTHRVALGSYDEINVSSQDVSQAFDGKGEELSDVQAEEEEEDPLLVTSPVVKIENEVGSWSVCKFHKYAGFCLIFIIFISLSA